MAVYFSHFFLISDGEYQHTHQRSQPKFVFISGHKANVIAHQGILDDGVTFIQKPFSMADMAKQVRELLDMATDENKGYPKLESIKLQLIMNTTAM